MQFQLDKGLILVPAGMFLIFEKAATEGRRLGRPPTTVLASWETCGGGIGETLVVPGLQFAANLAEALGGVKIRAGALGG